MNLLREVGDVENTSVVLVVVGVDVENSDVLVKSVDVVKDSVDVV